MASVAIWIVNRKSAPVYTFSGSGSDRCMQVVESLGGSASIGSLAK
jgi:hypothetical protein